MHIVQKPTEILKQKWHLLMFYIKAVVQKMRLIHIGAFIIQIVLKCAEMHAYLVQILYLYLQYFDINVLHHTLILSQSSSVQFLFSCRARDF